MKKLAFLFVAVAAISFASCGNKTEQGAACDSACAEVCDSAAIEEVAEPDTTVAESDSTAAEVEAAPEVQ